MFGRLNVLLMLGITLCLGLALAVPRDLSQPNYEFVPERQMARSPAFGTYAPNPNFADGSTFRPPVPGTIPQGWKAFPYAFTAPETPYGPTPVDAVRAGKELKNPWSHASAEVRKQGALLYVNNCQFCHGPTGNGDGNVSGRGFPAPLSFLKPQGMNMKDGEMFHILTFGKGNMPAHAMQLSPADRWTVIVHVRVLQNKYTEIPNVRLADTILTFRANCAACHGEDGAGSLMRGKLPNLPDFSSMAWQLSKANLEITNRIEYGDEPLMPTFRYRLTRDQILGLAIYIRTLSFQANIAGSSPKLAPLPLSAAGLQPVQILRAFCLACHNVDGKGAIVRPGMPDIPDFTSAAWYGSKKDADLSKSILSGGKFMPPMKDKLTHADADKMVQFVRGFRDGKFVVPQEKAAPQVVVKTPPEFTTKDKTQPPVVKDKIRPEPTSPDIVKRLRAANVLFREYCLVCHGPDGTGVAVMRAVLPPLPDFTKASFQEQHSDSQLLISILEGKGTLMPANRGRITEAQARDLAAYIRAFAPAGTNVASTPPSEFQQQFEQLQQQWEALEKEIRAMKK